MRAKAQRIIAVLAVGATTAGVLAATQSSGRAGAARAAAPMVANAAGGERSVTLITGHVVRVGPDEAPTIVGNAGGSASRPVVPGVSFARYQRDGDWYVVPTDAMPMVRSGLVDQRLFNVTDLVDQGYDDAGSPVVPLLVQYAETGAARKATSLAGAKTRRVLPKLKLTANDEPKSDTARFWADLVRQADPKAHTIRGGVRKVWLNARYRASLERSVPQVGAPAAWQAGYTGRDVTVAVLDSGYDTDHPDLAGQVSAAKNFTDSANGEDRAGHGTHVASTIAGSGAASDGRRRGVAPDADLAVGKVLDDSGHGFEDWILAGMEWAVTEAGAKVVNMSLGGPVTDGTDPISQAVNQLSADHGALFVVAAGNNGATAPVSSPASADAALAVSSVDGSDRISAFSSRGPRWGDGALKPELAAPGERITAARATGTYPDIAGEADYVPLSGTSMAAPHVAGAAAILAQQHPDWSGAQLKAALVASAAPARESRVFDVGAGRLDVARAVNQRVRVTPASLNTRLPWGAKDETRELTYTNDGAAPITLNLALSMTDTAGVPAPTGLITLDANTLTVPARGTASVSVRFAGQSRSASYGGVLVATAGEVTLRTPVGVLQDAETHDMKVRVLNRDGAPALEAHTTVVGLDEPNFEEMVPESGHLSVPTGRYALVSHLTTLRPGGEPLQNYVGYPQVEVTDDATVTVDMRWARPVPLDVADQPAATYGLRAVEIGIQPKGSPNYLGFIHLFDPAFPEVEVGSAPGVTAEEFSFTNTAVLERPELELSATSPQQFPVKVGWLRRQPGSVPPFDGTAQLPAVRVTVAPDGQPAAVDVTGKLAVLTAADESTERFDVAAVVRTLKERGARMVMMATGQFTWTGETLALPTITTAAGSPGLDQFVTLAGDGTLTATVTGRPVSPFRYLLGFQERGSIPPGLAYHAKTVDLAAVPTSYHGTNNEWRGMLSQINFKGRYHHVSFYTPVVSPLRRTEYYTPGSWRASIDNDVSSDITVATMENLRPGENPPMSWDKAVLGPALTEPNYVNADQPWVSRQDDVIDVTLPMFTDAAGHPRFVSGFGDITGTTSLYRDGQLVGAIAKPGRGQFGVSAGDASYRLTATATHHSPSWPLNTTVSGSWTFRSQTEPTRKPLPLLGMSLDAPVDLHNTAPIGESQPVRVSVHRQAGVADLPITALTVDVSYDDGHTWRPVTVTRDGNTWWAQVPHDQAGYVSLRASATDTDGNAVEQTIIRAYQVGS